MSTGASNIDHTKALDELLMQYGFRRHALVHNQVRHLQLVGELANRRVDVLVDTGAASTVVDLVYCRSEGIATRDTGRIGGGAGGFTLPIHVLNDATLTLDGLAIRVEHLYALDLSHVNHGLTTKGATHIHVVLGADALLNHQAVIDYATLSLFLKHEPA